jgi:hypothetical protein
MAGGRASSNLTPSEQEHLGVFAKYARLWTVIATSVGTILGTGLIFVGYATKLRQPYAETVRAVGQSIIASVMVYVLISLILDPVRQKLQAREISMYAIEVANEQFQKRFEAALPIAVFESSKIPKPAFRDAFVRLLLSSRRYDIKGSSAEFTTFRLAAGSQHREFRTLDQIRLCLLDPQADDLLYAQAHLSLREAHQHITDLALSECVTDLRNRIYVSLVTLFDIRDALRTTVYFHHDLPLFRCELFDDGMFLTYYLDGVDYSESLQFARSTRPYRAYATSMELTRNFAAQVMLFSTTGPSRDLVNTESALSHWLGALGCTLAIDDLRTRRDERFEQLRNELDAAGIASTELF